MSDIKILNEYKTSIIPDCGEKTGLFLTYPTRVLCGKRFQSDMVKEDAYSTERKIVALACFFLVAPLVITATIIGLICIKLSSSHQKCRKIHSKVMKGMSIAGNEHLPIKEQAKQAAEACPKEDFSRINHLLTHATVKETPLILEGLALHQSLSFQKGLGFLIANADQTSSFGKVHAALQSEKVLEILRDNLNQDASCTSLQLPLLVKHSERLSLPQDIVTKMNEILTALKQKEQQEHYLSLKEKVKQAAEQHRKNSPLHFSNDYHTVKELLISSPVEDIVPLLEGCLENETPIVFTQALGYLMEDANHTCNFDKVQTALNSSKIQTALMQRIEQYKGYCLQEHTHKTHYMENDELKLQLFLKNSDKLSMPAEFLQKMKELLALFEETDANTSNLPKFYFM